MSTVLVAGVVTLTVNPGQPLPAGSAAQASIAVVVTDAAGTVSPTVALTGLEAPTPWAFPATLAAGDATFVATAMDVNGAAIGAPVSGTFPVAAKAEGTFNAPVSASFAAT